MGIDDDVISGFSSDGAPTLDAIRDKIERRAAIAIGTEELAAQTPEVQALEDQQAEREKRAKEKLEQIRASMKSAD